MGAPGVKIADVIDRFGIDELIGITGKDVDRTLEAVVGEGGRFQALKRVAEKILFQDANRLLADPQFRRLLHSYLSDEKLIELRSRTRWEGGGDTFSGIEEDRDSFSKYLGFFGVSPDRVKSAPVAEPCRVIHPSYGLFSHQNRVKKKAYEEIRRTDGRIVIHMPTGSGKTRTAMHVISSFLKENNDSLVIWLASSSELLEQAAEAFEEAWSAHGDEAKSVYRLWGATPIDIDELGAGIIITGFAKLNALSGRDPISLLKLGTKTKLVVVDEAHQAIAPTYRKIVEKLCNTGARASLLGLTATPGRSWSDISKDEELAEFFGYKKVALEISGWSNPVSYLIQNGFLARPKFVQLENDNRTFELRDENDFGSDYADRTLSSLGDDDRRNALIVQEVKRLSYERHSRIIIFCVSVEHAVKLTAVLSYLEISSDYVTGDTPAEKRARIIKDFRIASNETKVLCNFGVLTTGFDAPQTSAAIIARPTRSLVLFSQMVGRAIRGPKAGGNETAEIITVVDTSLPGFGDVASAFTNWEDVWDSIDRGE